MKLLFAASIIAAGAAAVSYPRTPGQDICCALNVGRADAGLAPFKWSPKLDAAAQGHSDYMRDNQVLTAVETPGTSTYSLTDRLKLVGFDYDKVQGPVAMGWSDLSDLRKSWLNERTTNGGILSKDYIVCGGGISNPGNYIAGIFASPANPADESEYCTLSCNGNKSNGVSGLACSA